MAKATVLNLPKQTTPQPPAPTLIELAEAELAARQAEWEAISGRAGGYQSELNTLAAQLRKPNEYDEAGLARLRARQAEIEGLLNPAKEQLRKVEAQRTEARAKIEALQREARILQQRKEGLEHDLSPRGVVGRREQEAREAAEMAQRLRLNTETQLATVAARLKKLRER